MNQSDQVVLNEELSFFDDSIRINKSGLDELFDAIKNKPISRKLHLSLGGVQSSILKVKELTTNLMILNYEMDMKIFRMALNAKQIAERVEHHPKYQKYQTNFEIIKKNFSVDVEIWRKSLDEFMSNYEHIDLLLNPLDDEAEEQAVLKVDQFNRELNQKVKNTQHLFEDMKQKYLHLLQYQKELEELMTLCGIQQTK